MSLLVVRRVSRELRGTDTRGPPDLDLIVARWKEGEPLKKEEGRRRRTLRRRTPSFRLGLKGGWSCSVIVSGKSVEGTVEEESKAAGEVLVV